jgi:hypothetical protein
VHGTDGVKLNNQNLEFRLEDLPVVKQRELEAYVYKCLNLPIPVPSKKRP